MKTPKKINKKLENTHFGKLQAVTVTLINTHCRFTIGNIFVRHIYKNTSDDSNQAPRAVASTYSRAVKNTHPGGNFKSNQ